MLNVPVQITDSVTRDLEFTGVSGYTFLREVPEKISGRVLAGNRIAAIPALMRWIKSKGR